MSNAGMKAKPEMRVEWHNLMQEGKTPEEIGQQYSEHPVVVVKTLRQGTPKIKGTSYQSLSLPIPIEEIKEADANGTIEDLARKYGVSGQTLKVRLENPKRRPHKRKVDKISDKDKIDAVNAYYQSGRKLNCTTHTPNILKQILDEKDIREKVANPISSKYVVRLMDALLSINPEHENSRGKIQTALRYIVNLTSNNPLVWKGQVLDLLLTGEFNESTARVFSCAIDRVAIYMKDEHDADS